MTVIFIFPLVFSAVGVLFFLKGEATWVWKLIALGLVALSIALQFVPAMQVHFLIPLGIQLFLCGWIGLWLQVRQ